MFVKRVIKVTFVVVILLLIYDLGWKEFQQGVHVHREPLQGTDFQGTLALNSLRYDTVSHSVRTSVTFQLNAVGAEDINDVSFTLNDNANPTHWLFADSKNPSRSDCPVINSYEYLNASKTHSSGVLLDCHEVSLPVSSPKREILYPFDSYRINLDPRACANNPAGPCIGKSDNASIVDLDLNLADPNLIADATLHPGGREVVVHLGRRLFVRIVSVVFLILSVAFLGYLVRLTDAKDLLQKSIGFFATLWGLRILIVPPSITFFPTIVDYCILTLFCVLFLLIILKVQEAI